MHRDTIDLLAGITYDMMNWTRFSLPSVRVSDRKWKKKQVKEEQVEERRGPKETLEHHRIWLEVPGGFCASSPSELWKSLCVSSFGDCRFSFLFSLFFLFFRLFSFSFFFIYLSIYFFFFFFLMLQFINIQKMFIHFASVQTAFPPVPPWLSWRISFFFVQKQTSLMKKKMMIKMSQIFPQTRLQIITESNW